jgi:hypothetical protein
MSQNEQLYLSYLGRMSQVASTPVKEVSGVVRTRKPERQNFALENFGEPFQIECENLMAGILQFESGTIGNVLFDANSIFTVPERPVLTQHGTLGILYMADPDHFGGEVKVILKGNNEPFVMQQSHAFTEEYRGLGVAEMAWSMRMGRKNRASKRWLTMPSKFCMAWSRAARQNRIRLSNPLSKKRRPSRADIPGKLFLNSLKKQA